MDIQKVAERLYEDRHIIKSQDIDVEKYLKKDEGVWL